MIRRLSLTVTIVQPNTFSSCWIIVMSGWSALMVRFISVLLELPDWSVTVRMSVPSSSIVAQELTTWLWNVSVALHGLPLSSVHDAMTQSHILSSPSLNMTVLPPETSVSDCLRVILGGVTSARFLSWVQEKNAAVMVHAAIIGVVARITAMGYLPNSFVLLLLFQLISSFPFWLCVFLFALNMFQGKRSLTTCGASFCHYAYPWTAAVPTCLHIPMQLNMAYFPFPVPAPALPAIPLLPDRTVNADKRYPRPWPHTHARKTGIPD